MSVGVDVLVAITMVRDEMEPSSPPERIWKRGLESVAVVPLSEDEEEEEGAMRVSDLTVFWCTRSRQIGSDGADEIEGVEVSAEAIARL